MSRSLCKAFQPAAVAVFGELAALSMLAVPSMLAAPAYAQAHVDEHAAGRTVYTQWCAPCHAAGVTHPGTHALTVKYQGVKPGVLLEWRDLPANTVKFVVRHGISVMPQFRKTEINDQDLDALAKFLSRNSPAN